MGDTNQKELHDRKAAKEMYYCCDRWAYNHPPLFLLYPNDNVHNLNYRSRKEEPRNS